MGLEDIIYELACLHESMLFCCEDRSGKEDPVFAHYCMALGRIVGDLEEAERRLPGLDVVLHPQVDTHKKPPISRVQEMGGSSAITAGAFLELDLRDYLFHLDGPSELFLDVPRPCVLVALDGMARLVEA